MKKSELKPLKEKEKKKDERKPFNNIYIIILLFILITFYFNEFNFYYISNFYKNKIKYF